MNQTKSTSKKLLALLLALIMTVSLLPMSVFAAELATDEPAQEAEEAIDVPADGENAEDVESADGEEDGVSVYAAADEIAVQAATINYVTKTGEGKSLKGDTSFYRIFLLDCGRKYFSVDEIKDIIDQLAANHFTHIELAFGNDGLRFLLDNMELDGYDYTSDQVRNAIQKGNDSFDSGTYYSPGSKEELTEEDMGIIIGYAKENGIGVIPLFNAPGHMYTVVNAMINLRMSMTSGTDYIEGAFGNAGKAANWAVIPTSATAVNFVQALMQKYVNYFAKKGCTMFNIGADESGIDTNTYPAYAKLINSHAAMVQNAGMVALAFNDGINRTDMTVGTYDPFDTNIAVCYWAEDKNNAYNSVKNLYDAGFTIINNNDAWYYVLGDFLYEEWGVNGQWGYNTASAGIKNTPVTQAKNLADKTIELAGSVLCCWCDGPKKSFSDSKEKVYDLIEAMAKENQDYFKAEEKPAEPELVVDTAAGGVTATKQNDGSYSVAVKANDTVKLTVNNYSGSLKWTSNDTSVATVDSSGKVTFTGIVGKVTITAESEATKGETAAAYSITFSVTKRTGGDLTNVPAYTEGKVTGSTTEVEYVLDTDGVDAGERYLIVAANSGVALRRSGSSVTTQSVMISGDKATITSNTETSLWTFSDATSGTIKNDTYYLSRNKNSLGVSTSNNNNNNSWTIKNNSGGTYQIYYTSRGTNYYLAANGTGSNFTLTTNASNVSLYKQQTKAAGFTVDTTNLKTLIDYAEKLTASEYTNWTTVGMDNALKEANDALAAVNNPYTTETAATTAQNSVNAAAKNLHDALAQLTRGKSVPITVYCEDESGTRIGEENGYTFYAYENAEGTYTYTFNAPTITGYRCNRGSLITGNVEDEGETVTLVYRKGSFTLPDSIEIPITIVDYRADGLLFDFSIANSSIAYQLVQISRTNNSVTDAQNAISGTTLTSLTPQDNATGRDTYWALGVGNGSYIRTGMVEETLGANGMPVYTDATVRYVADKLAQGICRTDTDTEGGHGKEATNWNDILYNTFLKSGAARSVRNSTTTGFSDAFANTKSYDNITNAYDLAWYLLNTLYIGDDNMAEVTDENTGAKYTLPIYGMADDTYNKLILVKDTDGTYYMKAYTDGAKLKYDEDNGAIYNSATDNTNISKFMYPLCGKGYDKYLGDTTDNQAGTEADTLYPVNPNGNYTLRGESQFVYYADQGQYFEFTGDDDVYLFINGKLVLDLGGAHWSLKKTVNMDDIAEKCGLEDGQIATFTFFYMERFSDCSNFGIRTNMGLVERGISVEKKGYDTSYANEIASGSVIENGTSVAYDLTVTNNGDSNMSQIKFVDTDKNGTTVSIGYDVTDPALTSGTGEVMFKLSEQTGYALFITDHNGAQVTNSREDFTTLQALSDAVGAITLTSGQTLHVRFLQVKANVPASKMADYSNTVTVTAVSGGQSLTDNSTHVLYAFNAKDTAKDYVVDFGLPLKITNIFDQSSKDYFADQDKPLTLNAASSIKYGELEISETGFNTVLTYTPKKAIDEVEKIVLDVNYKFGEGTNAFTTTLQKTIRIIPASTVYYEDDFMSFTNADNSTSVANAATAVNGFWYTDGNKPTETVYQALDKLGDQNANNYGYDPAYNSCTEYSLGSAVKVTVDADVKRETNVWPYATFTFKGTGFDIISLTDNTSGAIYVYVYKGNSIDEEKRVAGYVVNNYYGYTYNDETGEWATAENIPNAIYQVPVIKVSDLDYDQYTVKIMVGYSKYQDVAKKGSYSFWMDAIRVYDPAGTTAIDQDYAKDSEQNPDFVQLRKVLLDVSENEQVNGAVFIDGMGKTSMVANYKNYGPNHEVYLASGQAIAFQLVANAQPEGLQLGAKLANGSSATLTVRGATFAKNGTTDYLELTTATDMFYELSVNWTYKDELWKSDVITLTNSGSDMISLTNLKLINAKYTPSKDEVTNAASGEVLVTMMMDADAAQKAIAAVDSVLHPQEIKTFTPERFEVSWNRSTVKVGQKATLTVKTSEDVEAITVDGVTIDTYRTRTQRTGWGWNAKKVTYREFTYTITAKEAGTLDCSVAALNAENTASEAITAALTVQAAAQRPGFGGWLDKIFSRWF